MIGHNEWPLPARKGDWIQTSSDLQFWPLDPRASEVRLEDIARSLSKMCRFGGHVRSFYSVAQHSVLVSEHVSREHAVAALLHDATEAYLVDVPTPIKRFLSGYAEIEHKLAVVIGERFNVCLEPLPDEVKEADLRALITEKRDLKGPAPSRWTIPELQPWPETIRPWNTDIAYAFFMARASNLGIK